MNDEHDVQNINAELACAAGPAPEDCAPPLPPPSPAGGGEEKIPSVPAGAAPVDPADAFATAEGIEEYFFNEETRYFLRRNKAGQWISLSEGQMMRHLKMDRRLRDKPDPGKLISPAHACLKEVENDRRVAYAGVLAGYRAGVHTIAGRRVLVTEDPVFITPQKGEWPVLEKFFEGLFCGEEPGAEGGPPIKIDQRPWVFAWLKHTVECFQTGKTSTGLAFCLAGDPNCGKSMFALFVRWMLGGRVAKPYRFMLNDDSFNRDLVEAVLQLIDDENQADTNYQARQKFAGEVKMIVANNEFRVRAMHTDPFAIPVLRRLMVLCNLQGTRLLVLPPLDGDVDDKIALFKGYARPAPKAPITNDTPAEQACWPMPMPTRTEPEREAFREKVAAELPAFLWWLLFEYKMPSFVSGGRFIVRHYHHPALVAALQEHSPHVRFWDLLVRARVVFQEYVSNGADAPAEWKARPEGWRGTAGDLEQLLKKSDACQLSKEERSEIKAANWLGRTLELCQMHFGEDVCSLKRTDKGRIWTLKPRKEDL